MVLLSSLAMHPVRSRPPTRDALSTSSPHPGYPTTPVAGYPHSNGYFYSPSHSSDTPEHTQKGRRFSGPNLGGSVAMTSSHVTSPVTSPGVYSSLNNLDTWSPSTVSVSSLLRQSGDVYGKPSRKLNNGFVHVNGGIGGSGGSGSVMRPLRDSYSGSLSRSKPYAPWKLLHEESDSESVTSQPYATRRSLHESDSGSVSQSYASRRVPQDSDSQSVVSRRSLIDSRRVPQDSDLQTVVSKRSLQDWDSGSVSKPYATRRSLQDSDSEIIASPPYAPERSLEDSDSGGMSQTYTTSPMPTRSSSGGGVVRDKTLRRTMSADPRKADRDPYYPCGRPLGSPHPGEVSGGGIPRVCSDGDLLESEYVTLDYTYVTMERVGGRSEGESGRVEGKGYGSNEECGHPSDTSHNLSMDSVHRKYSDNSFLYTSPTSSSSSSFHPYNNNKNSNNAISYTRSCSDDNNDYAYANGYSSDYGSGRSGSGSTGSLQRSGTLPTNSGSKHRAMSAERLLNHSRSISPMDRGSRGTPPRKKTSMTLQTVAEITVQGSQPGKGILKNGSGSATSSESKGPNLLNTNDAGAINLNGSGTNTPRSANSSRRSSLNSRVNGSQDSGSIISSEFAQDPNKTPSVHAGPNNLTTPLNSILIKHNNLSHTFANTATRSSTKRTNEEQNQHPRILRLRSKSMSDLREDTNNDATTTTANSGCYSDDEDGDDFGFLSNPGTTTTTFVSRPPTAMHKAKSAGGTSSPSHRLLPRRWRNKNKSGSSPSHPPAQPMWSPEGPCTWCSVSGRKVILKPVNILQLSEAERLALQKLAMSKLQAMDLSCPIVIPKDASDLRRQKKRALSLKRRSKSANLASLLDTLSSDKGKDKENKDVKPAGLVFGIPLSRCITNDKELAKKRNRTQNTALKTRTDSADHVLTPRPGRKSSSSSQGSVDNTAHNGTSASANPYAIYDSARRAASSDSLSESDHSSRNTSSNLIEALALHASQGERPASQAVGSTPQVPHIVDACFKHLETYGLQVLGIFRVGSSKKRVKQLREEFDSGKDVVLTDDHNPHDVGALLKEFFRDLPEPLLTRDLYPAFVATRKIKDREIQAEAVRLLLTLLPAANRDTLWALLRFLATVHRHSVDSTDRHGREVPGNKMDSHNLATLFGPNVLHRARACNEKQFMAECAVQAEQTSEVIGVVKDMIDNHWELFEITATQRDEVLRLMMEADHENLDKVLRRLSNENQIEPDPESMCSVFESETDPPLSLPHNANSDADLLSLARRKGPVHHHQPLRVSRSADPWTDPPQCAHPSPTTSSHPFADGGRRVCSLDSASEERVSHSPSPQDSPSAPFQSPRATSGTGSGSVSGSMPRPPLVTISQESPEVVLRSPSASGRRRRGQDTASGVMARPLSAHVTLSRERPYSENYAESLNIPKPAYLRENSGASSASSSYLSSSGGHASDGSGHWVLPTPPVSRGSSPTAPRRSHTSRVQSNSRSRPLLTSSSRSDDDDGASATVGSPEWQRERWRHWEQITAGRNNPSRAGDAEQETLV
ncbi:rho GTPase-activating protein 6-like [Littorina saxatilis]|uniref:Rho-GAP domain-containing protein n=1 Tax=Littorina saxatilis TaxID=31220 RepID=A0AAN9G6H2_9CAEN